MKCETRTRKNVARNLLRKFSISSSIAKECEEREWGYVVIFNLSATTANSFRGRSGANLLVSINLLSHDSFPPEKKRKKETRSLRNRHNQPRINHTPTSFRDHKAERFKAFVRLSWLFSSARRESSTISSRKSKTTIKSLNGKCCRPTILALRSSFHKFRQSEKISILTEAVNFPFLRSAVTFTAPS